MKTSAPLLLDSDDQEALRSAVREVLEDHAPWGPLIDALEVQDPLPKVWTVLAQELGVTALPVPEALGGGGGTWIDAAVVLEELGRRPAPTPFLTNSVLSVALLLALADESVLPGVAEGAVATIAIPFGRAALNVGDLVSWDGTRLRGSVPLVAGVPGIGGTLLVVVDDKVVSMDVAGAKTSPVVSFDQTRPLVDLTFDGSPGRVVGEGPHVTAAARRAAHIGYALLASEQLGVVEGCMAMTRDYLLTRHQFGRPIGSFQAIKHRMADLWSDLARARAAARYAAVCAAEESPDLEVAASVAQAICGDLAVRAAEECVQMHGGIGFTWEHPAHIYLKRARASSLALGATSWHRHQVGVLLDLAPRGAEFRK